MEKNRRQEIMDTLMDLGFVNKPVINALEEATPEATVSLQEDPMVQTMNSPEQ